MKTQAKDLRQIIPEGTDDDASWQKDVTNNQVRASRLQGISDSVSDFTKMYLKKEINDPKATYFGMSDIGSTMMTLPETKEQRALAVVALKDALESIETSATESVESTKKIYEIVKNIQKQKCKKGGPPVQTPVTPAAAPSPVKSEKLLASELQERTVALKNFDIIIENTKRGILEFVSDTRIITTFPQNIVQACQMMLFTKKSELRLAPKEKKYMPSSFVAANMILHEPTKPVFNSDPPKRLLRLFNIPVETIPREKVIQNIREADPDRYRPRLDISIASREMTLTIPPFYVDSTIPGVGKWNRLLGFVAYLKITVKNRPARAPEEYVYIYVNGDLDHGTKQDLEKPTDKLSITLNSASWRIGHNEFGWDKDEPLYLKLFKKRWVDAKVNVARIYATTKLASTMYGRLQHVTQALLWKNRLLNFGTASTQKLGLLMSMISNQTNGFPDVPIGLMLDLNISKQ